MDVRTGIIGLFLAGPGLVLNGQEALELSPLTVIADRREQAPIDVPRSLSVQGRAHLQDEAPRTMADMLEAFPGLMVQRTAYGQASPYIRGFTGFHTLLLVDGIRVNNSIFRSGPNQYWATVDPLIIERLELLRGPASVMYGSDAVGGAVNLTTLQPRLGTDASGQVQVRASSAERSLVGRLEAGLRIDRNSAAVVGLSWRDFGDLEGGAEVGRQEGTAYEAGGADLKWIREPDRFSRWTVAAQVFRQNNVPRTHSTVDGLEWSGTVCGSNLQRDLDQLRALTYARYERRFTGAGMVDSFQATISWQAHDETEDRIRGDGRRQLSDLGVDTVGVSLIGYSAGKNVEWDYGLDWYHDEVESGRRDYRSDGSLQSVRLQGPVGDDASYDLAGCYLQATVPLAGDLELSGSGRYNYAAAEVGVFDDPTTGQAASLSRDWQKAVFSSQLLWKLDSTRRLFAAVGQSFRAPNLSDLTRLDIARSSEIETPAPDLEPEDFVSYELGFKHESGTISLEASVFHTDIVDQIIRTPAGSMLDGRTEVTKLNGGKGWVRGVETAGHWRVSPTWELFGHCTWLEGEQEVFADASPQAAVVTEPLSRLMPFTIKVGGIFRLTDYPLEWRAAVRHAARADRLSSADWNDTQRIPPSGTPGYTVIDLQAVWRPNPTWFVSLGVENVFDEDYRIHGSGFNAPGRNIVATVRLRL